MMPVNRAAKATEAEVPMYTRKCLGFTLVEMLVVMAVVALLVALILPSLSGARKSAQQMTCLSNMRQLASGWHSYSLDNHEVMLPGRFPNLPGGMSNPANFYKVGNGTKFRARYLPVLGRYIDSYSFANPNPSDDRQDFDNALFACPSAPERVDDGNCAWGYNHQFLGNSRLRGGVYRNFPLKQTLLQIQARTVLFADSLGTAAGFAERDRKGYSNNGTNLAEIGNHAWSLDPPRLTPGSDRGTGNVGSTRTAVDPRHAARANTMFCDGHGGALTADDLGYRRAADGKYLDMEPGGPSNAPPTNALFSGSGTDKDPV